MKKSEKIAIGKEFVSLHKQNDVNLWQIKPHTDIELMYLDVFYNLVGGLYGYSEIELMPSDCGSYRVPTNTMEINGSDSNSGNPIIFEWPYLEFYQ